MRLIGVAGTCHKKAEMTVGEGMLTLGSSLIALVLVVGVDETLHETLHVKGETLHGTEVLRETETVQKKLGEETRPGTRLEKPLRLGGPLTADEAGLLPMNRQLKLRGAETETVAEMITGGTVLGERILKPRMARLDKKQTPQRERTIKMQTDLKRGQRTGQNPVTCAAPGQQTMPGKQPASGDRAVTETKQGLCETFETEIPNLMARDLLEEAGAETDHLFRSHVRLPPTEDNPKKLDLCLQSNAS